MLGKKVIQTLMLLFFINPMISLATESDKDNHITKEEVLTIKEGDFLLGNKDAKVKFFEYSSLSCPHCSSYHETVFPLIKTNYIDTGKIAYVMRDFPTNHPATLASRLIHCAGDRRVEFMETLFKTQRIWAFNMAYKEKLHNIAKLGGISDDDYEKCINDKEATDTMLNEAYQAVNALKLDATPVFFINGKKLEGIAPYKKFADIIEAALQG